MLSADGIETLITHLQLHNGAPGAALTANVVGSRVAASGKASGNNVVNLTGAWTGLPANQPFTHVSYWTAATNGVGLGNAQTPTVAPNDTTANAAGAVTITVAETLA